MYPQKNWGGMTKLQNEYCFLVATNGREGLGAYYIPVERLTGFTSLVFTREAGTATLSRCQIVWNTSAFVDISGQDANLNQSYPITIPSNAAYLRVGAIGTGTNFSGIVLKVTLS